MKYTGWFCLKSNGFGGHFFHSIFCCRQQGLKDFPPVGKKKTYVFRAYKKSGFDIL